MKGAEQEYARGRNAMDAGQDRVRFVLPKASFANEDNQP